MSGPVTPESWREKEMDKLKDGRAFPHEFDGRDGSWFQEGMTLRDYFAGQALAGIVTLQPTGKSASTNRSACAVASYQLADEMLAERDK